MLHHKRFDDHSINAILRLTTHFVRTMSICVLWIEPTYLMVYLVVGYFGLFSHLNLGWFGSKLTNVSVLPSLVL
jgi:hypothetical protein